jgi:hypothetical protein
MWMDDRPEDPATHAIVSQLHFKKRKRRNEGVHRGLTRRVQQVVDPRMLSFYSATLKIQLSRAISQES